jgi:hypothetical protein
MYAGDVTAPARSLSVSGPVCNQKVDILTFIKPDKDDNTIVQHIYVNVHQARIKLYTYI